LDASVRDNVIIYTPQSIRTRVEMERRCSTDELRTFTRARQRFSAGE